MEIYQQRVITELRELTTKYEALKYFIQTGSIDDLPDAEQARLIRQLDIMKLYMQVLDERINGFK